MVILGTTQGIVLETDCLALEACRSLNALTVFQTALCVVRRVIKPLSNMHEYVGMCMRVSLTYISKILLYTCTFGQMNELDSDFRLHKKT